MDSFRNIVSNISDLADKMSLPRADKLSLMVRKNGKYRHAHMPSPADTEKSVISLSRRNQT